MRYVIGKTLKHTLSPQIHGFLGDGFYGIKELEEGEVEQFVSHGDWSGLNVTIPYKQTVMRLLDGVDTVSREIGAVNTVVRVCGQKIGFNTDVYGMEYALSRAGIDLNGKSVLILGSGGAGRCAEYVAKKSGAKNVAVVSRKGELNYTNCYDRQDVQIVINATPVGMYPDMTQSPVELCAFLCLEGVFDCVYNPLRTRFVQSATALGVKVASGLDMLVEQARVSHMIFVAGQRIDSEVKNGKIAKITTCEAIDAIESDVRLVNFVDVDKITQNIVENIKRLQRNVVLIGMGGAGKTTVGRAFAKATGRAFFDADEQIERECGEILSNIVKNEDAFRRIERQTVRNLSEKQGAVIACGGGVVLDGENIKNLKCNGILVWIKRSGFQSGLLYPSVDEAKRVYEKREPLYADASDCEIQNDGSVQSAVEKLVEICKIL